MSLLIVGHLIVCCEVNYLVEWRAVDVESAGNHAKQNYIPLQTTKKSLNGLMLDHSVLSIVS